MKIDKYSFIENLLDLQVKFSMKLLLLCDKWCIISIEK